MIGTKQNISQKKFKIVPDLKLLHQGKSDIIVLINDDTVLFLHEKEYVYRKRRRFEFDHLQQSELIMTVRSISLHNFIVHCDTEE